jgi:ADP-ribose pyrophosphatase YjhB (NUDIX family)
MTPTTEEEARLTLYQAASQHWAHAEQIRWTLLYNYLMASTILLLAWATLYASSAQHPKVQVVLAGAGAMLSALWVALGARATGFVSMYAATGRALEPSSQTPDSDGATLGPFASAAQHRISGTGIGRLAPSHLVLWLVPSLFLLVYAILFFLSVRNALLPSRVIPAWLIILAAILVIVFGLRSLRDTFRAAGGPRSASGYCFHCGSALTARLSGGRDRLVCTACGQVHYEQPIVGAGALVEEGGKLLLLKRSGSPFDGCWGLPGGHVEADENPEDAAAREVKEETGLTVSVTGLAGAFFFDDHPRGAGIFLVYRCRSLDGRPVATLEATTVSYFGPDEVPDELAGGGHRAAIQDWVRKDNPVAKGT